jgi:hypothetical protein
VFKASITKSRSGHYTVTVRKDGYRVAVVRKLPDLSAARAAAADVAKNYETDKRFYR